MRKTRVLCTGGLGLVGANYALHCLDRGDQVVVLDCWARGMGSEANAEWLDREEWRDRLRFVAGRVENPLDVEAALAAFDGVDTVIHAAAQSSVDVSMKDPILDFRSNALGTVTVLEGVRKTCPAARVVYLASNKVYDVTGWPTALVGSRYQWSVNRRVGPSEGQPFATDAREPYGASKIVGFYYCRAYAALYEMPVVIAVPSGMYGPRQFGRAEQGWLGWFVIATILHRPILIQGDGAQVRDMLHVRDVNTALDLLVEKAEAFRGEVFNIGGGPRNAVSLNEALSMIEGALGIQPIVSHTDWRPQDNKVYVSNISRMLSLGWAPTVRIEDGIREMCEWAKAHWTVLERIYEPQS